MKKSFFFRGAPKKIIIALADIGGMILVGGFSLLLRFDFSFAEVAPYAHMWFRVLPLQLLLTIVLFSLTRMYRYVWHIVTVRDISEMLLCAIGADVLFFIPELLFGTFLPVSISFLICAFQPIWFVGIRCAPRFLLELHDFLTDTTKNSDRVLIVGAGDGGRMLIREMNKDPRVAGRPCCLVDDSPDKQGKYIDGVRISGTSEDIPKLVEKEKIVTIVFAIPSAKAEDQRRILEICQNTGCRIRRLPGLHELVSNVVTAGDLRDVQVEDLLGRDPVRLDARKIDDFIRGKVVLVTGGGGSIGSELCRQIAARDPRTLIILDIYENNAYDIQQELRRTYGDRLDLRVEIASIRDAQKMDELFAYYRPEVVFHAAAHKHVPLMEDCPGEAVKNNIFGTYNVVCSAEKFGVRKFVEISTDKAVNPTNFMGATKRFCEMILQSRYDSATDFCSVRFGNVLGSNGSVVPLFKKQIQAGGPITITDKRIIRYFMTIPEAAQLVMEAGAIAKPSQIFVLDMGGPVKILTLAENLIRLSGKVPYKDIDIVEVGLRPGEKLYEELLMASQDLTRTDNKKIFIEQQEHMERSTIEAYLKRLHKAVYEEYDHDATIQLLRELVPTYHTPEEVNRKAIEAMESDGAIVPPPVITV